MPAFDTRFLSAFANALITEMFALGYNVVLAPSQAEITLEELAEIDRKFEDNRRDCLKNNQDKIQNKKKSGKI